jgi:hypothetical protein
MDLLEHDKTELLDLGAGWSNELFTDHRYRRERQVSFSRDYKLVNSLRHLRLSLSLLFTCRYLPRNDVATL